MKTNGTRKDSITPGRGGQRPQSEQRDEGVIPPAQLPRVGKMRGGGHSHDDFPWC